MAYPEHLTTLENTTQPNSTPKKLNKIVLLLAFLIAVICSTIVFAPYRVWEQPCLGDRANWDYFSQVIARGGVPYRDVVNIKTPLSAYVGAAGIIAGRVIGARDVRAIRFVYLALIILVVGCTVVVGSRYESDVSTGLIAGAVLMCFDTYVRLYNAGVQPKTPMVLFGLLTLWTVS